MVKILNCYLYAKKSYGILSKGAIFFGQPCIIQCVGKFTECPKFNVKNICKILQTFGLKSLVSRLGLGTFKSRSRLEFLLKVSVSSRSRNVNVSPQSQRFWPRLHLWLGLSTIPTNLNDNFWLKTLNDRLLIRSNVLYRLDCSCGSFYIGQTRRNLVNRDVEAPIFQPLPLPPPSFPLPLPPLPLPPLLPKFIIIFLANN